MRLTSIGFPGLAVPAALATIACTAAQSSPALSGPVTVARADVLAAEGAVRIEMRFRKPTGGTFAITGALSDKGSFSASGRLAKGKLLVTEVLSGKQGTIRIRAEHPCARGRGTWKVLSGSAAYVRMSGLGISRGGPRCAPTRYPVVAVYTGTVRTPPPPAPPPLAQPGAYGGATSQQTEVTLTVEASGRAFSGLRFTVDAPCTGGGVSFSRVTVSFPDRRELESDGSFSLSSPASFWTGTVVGRFTSKTTVQGTAMVSTRVSSADTTYPCSANVTWTASLPAPSAPPGRYCGFTLQGPGVCFDVSASGREVTHFESAVVARCFPGNVPPSQIEVSLRFDGSLPVGGHLGFAASRLPVAGLISGTASFAGVIQPNGAATGTVSLGPSVLEHEGTRYNCFSVTGRWEARRQA